MGNSGPYLALVDINRCQAAKGQSSAASAGAANYANAIVNVTRDSNSDPMVAKVWLSLTQQGSSTNVYAYLSATQSPATAPPYGAFRMDYIGESGGSVGFNGYIDATTPGVINFLETGQQSSNTALAMTASSTTSGSGTMLVEGNGNGGSNLLPSTSRTTQATFTVMTARTTSASTAPWPTPLSRCGSMELTTR